MANTDDVRARSGVEIDVTGWAVISDEPGGRDANKRWVAPSADAPREEQWLWKSRQPTGDGTELALTDCAEVFTSRIALSLGIPAAVCEFAVLGGEAGLISRNVSPPGYELNTGRAYLPEVAGYDQRASGGADHDVPGRMQRERGYTLDAVAEVLDGVEAPPGVDGVGAIEVFMGYLVLDALVANGDRHPGNWAILERQKDGRRFLAPTYDHGSALGAGLTETNRAEKDPVRFARRGRANPFEPAKTLLVDLARDAVGRCGPTPWLERVATIDRPALREAFDAPATRLSESAAIFMERVVLENRRRLCDDALGQD